jgi:hypothetical protein
LYYLRVPNETRNLFLNIDYHYGDCVVKLDNKEEEFLSQKSPKIIMELEHSKYSIETSF